MCSLNRKQCMKQIQLASRNLWRMLCMSEPLQQMWYQQRKERKQGGE